MIFAGGQQIYGCIIFPFIFSYIPAGASAKALLSRSPSSGTAHQPQLLHVADGIGDRCGMPSIRIHDGLISDNKLSYEYSQPDCMGKYVANTR